MGIRCFLVEPVLDEKTPLPYEKDGWPPFFAHIGFRNPLTGEVKDEAHQFGPGAMWWATWMGKNWLWDNETEPHLCVEVPDGFWDVDSRCANCTLPDDRLHRCWVRHGVPPDITVDKNGLTCGAGGGSVQMRSWHGFLRNGELTT